MASDTDSTNSEDARSSAEMVGAVDARPPDPRAQPDHRAAGRAEHALSRRIPQSSEQGADAPDPDRGDGDGAGASSRPDPRIASHSRHRLEVDRKPAAALRPDGRLAGRQLAPDRADLPAARPEHAEAGPRTSRERSIAASMPWSAPNRSTIIVEPPVDRLAGLARSRAGQASGKPSPSSATRPI